MGTMPPRPPGCRVWTRRGALQALGIGASQALGIGASQALGIGASQALGIGAVQALPGAHAAPVVRTLVAGAGQALPTLRAALAEARDGDTIELLQGVHRGDVGVADRHGLVIRGRGAGAVLHADGASAEGKGILVVRGDVTLENLEFRGARVAAGNGAGVRFESGRLALDRCRFHDNEMGLLSANARDMELVVRRCVFGAAPRDDVDLHHLVYVGRIGSFVLEDSRLGGGWRGHLVKSRAARNRLARNRIDDGPDGEASYEVDFPEGGVIELVGNVVAQSARTQNPVVLSVGAEGNGLQDTRVVLSRNTFVNGAGETAQFVRIWRDRLGALTLQMSGNVFAGPGRIDGAAGDDNHRIATAALRDAARGDFRLAPGSPLAGRAGAP